MQYQYCPLCGEALAPHAHGKYCKTCAAKQRKKIAKRVAICTGVTIAVGGVAIGTAAYRSNLVRKKLKKIALRLPVEQSVAALQQAANAAQNKAQELLAQTDGLREQAKELLAAAREKIPF